MIKVTVISRGGVAKCAVPDRDELQMLLDAIAAGDRGLVRLDGQDGSVVWIRPCAVDMIERQAT